MSRFNKMKCLTRCKLFLYFIAHKQERHDMTTSNIQMDIASFDKGPYQIMYEEFLRLKGETIQDLNTAMQPKSRTDTWIGLIPKLVLLHHTQREYWTSLYV